MSGARASQAVTTGPSAAANVLVAGLDRYQLASIAGAFRNCGAIRTVQSFEDLRRSLRESSNTVEIVVLAARDQYGESARRTIRELAQERPRAAIVVYCHIGWQRDTDVRTLAVNGAHQFIFAGMNDDIIAVRAVVESAKRQCAAECVMQLLAPVVPATLHPMLEAALARPDGITELSALAASLGVHRKTLFNICKRAGFLGPAELLAWVRLMLVGYLLETTGCTVERIAIDLSYPSPTALRNAFRRYIGLRASQVRACGGARAVLEALCRRMRSCRQIH